MRNLILFLFGSGALNSALAFSAFELKQINDNEMIETNPTHTSSTLHTRYLQAAFENLGVGLYNPSPVNENQYLSDAAIQNYASIYSKGDMSLTPGAIVSQMITGNRPQAQNFDQSKWIQVTNPASYANTKPALAFLKEIIGPTFDKATLSKAYTQDNGYQFLFDVNFTSTIKLQYQIILSKQQIGFIIQKSQYLTEPPIKESYKLVTDIRNAPYIEIIDQQVRKTLVDSVATNCELLDLSANLPYYVIRYKIGGDRVLRLELMFDVVTNTVVIADTANEAVSVSVGNGNVSTSTTIKPTLTSSTSTISTPTSPSVEKVDMSLPLTPIVSTPKTPTYTLSLTNSNLLPKIADISDPALIPFLTYTETISQSQIDTIVKYLISKVNITNNFEIVLINQIKYGIRLVLQTDDKKIFEAVITSDATLPQLLSWKRITTISDVNPEVFSQYYPVQSDTSLVNLLREVFGSSEVMNKFKQIISAEKKVSFDGIYYRFTIESTSGTQFLVEFYYIPDKKYNEIIHYEIIDNGYQATSETKLTQIPQDDQTFKSARDHLTKNYAAVLQDSIISYAATFENPTSKYFRFVFSGSNGKYESILATNKKSQDVTVSRWEKLENGYVPLPIEHLSNNQEFNSVRSSIQDYIKAKFNMEAKPKYFEIKNIPNESVFYKSIFDAPFPFELSLEEKLADHSLTVRGMERIQISPSNEYYNDRVFAGFSTVKLGELSFDENYQKFYAALQSKAGANDKNCKPLAAFRITTPVGLAYKVVYNFNNTERLANFGYSFTDKNYALLSFEPYTKQIEEGDYRWKCSSINTNKSICQTCEPNFLLTSGRCYSSIPSCDLQIASSCYSCSAGNVRSQGICSASPAITIPKTPENAEKSIVTATGTKTITFNVGNDQNCLQYKDALCEQCSYRYFVKNGVCKKVKDECDTFDKGNGNCYSCHSSYYLSNGACIAMDPLCQEANNKGECTKCYKNYINIEGKCYIQSNIQISSTDTPKDELCISWSAGQCSQCEFGTFLSNKTGKCTIKDPFCQEFNEQVEECTICMRGYKKSVGGRCER